MEQKTSSFSSILLLVLLFCETRTIPTVVLPGMCFPLLLLTLDLHVSGVVYFSGSSVAMPLRELFPFYVLEMGCIASCSCMEKEMFPHAGVMSLLSISSVRVSP